MGDPGLGIYRHGSGALGGDRAVQRRLRDNPGCESDFRGTQGCDSRPRNRV